MKLVIFSHPVKDKKPIQKKGFIQTIDYFQIAPSF